MSMGKTQCQSVRLFYHNYLLAVLTLIAYDEPEGPLWRADDYAADNPNSPRINATLLSLVRNSEVYGMVQAMRDLERTWNHKFNYPWTFFNDEPFSEEFKKKTQAETNAQCNYGIDSRMLYRIRRSANSALANS